ncbi:hypothetical protein D039_0851A, partial [Vibrio parahaemolyticus EKP-028]
MMELTSWQDQIS